MADKVELRRGLRDVYFDNTESSNVIGDIGRLIYRGYDIHDLAELSTFEETVFLIMHGHLPTQAELDAFDASLKAAREIPQEIVDVITLTKDAHPMDVLRTAVSALAAFDSETADVSHEATLRKGIRITAQAPTIVAAHHRIRSGEKPIPPDNSLGHAGNFLYMLLGDKPDEDTARLMDKDLIVHLDHGSNASSFAARVTASTLADVHGAIVTGISTLKGPLHGGAAEGVMKMALEIGSEDKAHQYVADRLKNKQVIVGFGHRVYRTEDPRAKHLKEDAKRLSERRGDPKWFGILTAVVDAMAPYARRGIAQNVDLWSGAIYQILGIPESLYIPIFAMGRIPGWTAQVVEQLENNILLRPRLLYVGEMDRVFVPLDQR